jgi:hypothetical protein
MLFGPEKFTPLNFFPRVRLARRVAQLVRFGINFAGAPAGRLIALHRN